MNQKQLNIIKIVSVIIGLMLLYPPYRIYGFGINSNGIVATGYDFLFSLPNRAVVDISTLMAQWVGVAIIGFTTFYINRSQ